MSHSSAGVLYDFDVQIVIFVVLILLAWRLYRTILE